MVLAPGSGCAVGERRSPPAFGVERSLSLVGALRLALLLESVFLARDSLSPLAFTAAGRCSAARWRCLA